MITLGWQPRHVGRLIIGGFALVTLGVSAHGARAASVTAKIKAGVLTVTGTSGADVISARLKSGDSSTLEVDVGADGTADFKFDRQRFATIVIDGRGGGDTVVADPSRGTFTDTELTTLAGGDGNDTVVGANGAERLLGGGGDDVVDGNMGADTLSGGDGIDRFQWDPGDGSDTINGGTANDRLVFNGSGASERIELTPTAGHVQLTRDIAAITLDLDDLETVDLNPFTSADTITINNLTGTDLTTINTDLAAFGGSDDTQIDTVVTPPATTVGRDGNTAIVNGLGAQVRINNGAANDMIHVTGTANPDTVTVAGTTGPDTVTAVADGTDVVIQGATPGLYLRTTTVDQVHLGLAAGTDQFSTAGNLAALVALSIDGGDDDDTLFGGNGADLITGGGGDDVVDGNMGADTLSGGDGIDRFQWDPGDGSDTINGGTANDRLVFNGSGASERIELTPTAGHVQLTRDIAAITLDLDDLETVDLNPFTSADTITINNLTGTDLTTINTDLAAFGGAADGSADAVVVNGTAGDDTISLEDNGSAVEIDGLSADVQIDGADPTIDRLTVNGLGGSDVVTATDGAAALMVLELLP